jgi:hypothetical protein
MIIDSDYDHYLADITDSIEKQARKFGAKEPYITVKINGDGDREEVRDKLRSIKSAIIRPPIFAASSSVPEVKVGVNNATEFIKEYIRESPEIMKITLDFFREFRDDPEEAMNFLQKRVQEFDGDVS